MAVANRFRGELLALSSDLEKNLDYLCFAITAETRLLPLLKNILKREPLKEIARAELPPESRGMVHP